MESDLSTTKIDKLNESNYFAWKQKIVLLLALKDLDDHLDGQKPVDAVQQAAWVKKDRKAQAVIGLTLSDAMLEHVRDVDSAAEMWFTIKNVFERHTLLNKLTARRKFYSALKKEDETVLQFSNRIVQYVSTLRSMSVEIEDSDQAMVLLSGLPEQYDPLISALDAIGTDDTLLRFDHVKSRVLQEETRISLRISETTSTSESASLLSKNPCTSCPKCNLSRGNRPRCTHCGRIGHNEDRCWKKHPHLNLRNKPENSSQPVFIANNTDEDPNAICLIGKRSEDDTHQMNGIWYLDSGCSQHITYDETLFFSLQPPTITCIELGNGDKAGIKGVGSISLDVIRNGQSVRTELSNILLVPELKFQLLSISKFAESGLCTTFTNGKCYIRRGNTLYASGTKVGSLYRLDTSHPVQLKSGALVSATLKVWHDRLAHVSPQTIKEIVKSQAATGIAIKSDSSTDWFTCDGCVLGKAHRSIIPKRSFTRMSKRLELVHSDLNGPIEPASLGGSRYFITFIDDFSRWTVAFAMKQKSDSL